MHSVVRRVLVLQHAAPEHIGLIAEALRSEGIEQTTIRSDLGHPLPPDLSGFSGVIVMGGPQSVYEEERYPFLSGEKALVREAVSKKLPVLGICLGSQILSEVLGAPVHPGPEPEIGWKEVTIAGEARKDRVFQGLPEKITPLYWHGDVYALPPTSILLGSSSSSKVQGFALEGLFYGILFHLEMTREQLAAMVDEFAGELERAQINPDDLIREAPDKFAFLRDHSLDLFRRWASLV